MTKSISGNVVDEISLEIQHFIHTLDFIFEICPKMVIGFTKAKDLLKKRLFLSRGTSILNFSIFAKMVCFKISIVNN